MHNILCHGNGVHAIAKPNKRYQSQPNATLKYIANEASCYSVLPFPTLAPPPMCSMTT